MQCPSCDAHVPDQARSCSCGWKAVEATSSACQATWNFEPCCSTVAEAGSKFCATHAYIDGRVENPNRYYDGPGVTYQPPFRRPTHAVTSTLPTDGPPAPDNYFVQVAVLRHVTHALPIDKAMQEAYEAACARREVSPWETDRMARFPDRCHPPQPVK